MVMQGLHKRVERGNFVVGFPLPLEGLCKMVCLLEPELAAGFWSRGIHKNYLRHSEPEPEVQHAQIRGSKMVAVNYLVDRT